MTNQKNNYLTRFIDIIPNIDSPIKLFSYSIAAVVIIGLCAFKLPEYWILGIVLTTILLILIIYSYIFHKNISNIPRKIIERNKDIKNGNLLKDISEKEFENLYEITSQNNKNIKSNEIYDLYIACPMASFPENEREDVGLKLSQMLKVIREIYDYNHIECPASIQIGTNMRQNFKNYDPPKKAFMLCYSRILFSKRFILILPKILPTSALYELGLAMAFGKPITIIKNEKEELPFLLKEVHQLPVQVATYDFNGDIEEITNRIYNRSIKIEEE